MTTPALFYRAYGFLIESGLSLPELEPASPGVADLSIRMLPTPPDFPEPTAPVEFDFESGNPYMLWPAVGAFRIVDGRSIEIAPAPGVSEKLLPFPLLGPVMALLLHIRGMLVLHASAIAIGSESAVFLGDKMAGKSTTAAAFIRAGHRLLTDDLLALDFSGDTPLIAPAFPQLKLSEDSAGAVSLEAAEALPLVLPDFPKRQHRLSAGFSHTATQPTRIFVLKRGTKAAITRYPGPAALSALMRFSYISRFGSRALAGEEAARHLRQCAALSRVAQVCELEVPGDLNRLDEVVRVVEADLAAPAAAA
jgi:hypothetical protein